MAVNGSLDKPVLNINLERTFLVSCLVWLCVGLDFYPQLFADNGLSLVTGIAIVVGATVVEAAATTLLIMIGSGLVR